MNPTEDEIRRLAEQWREETTRRQRMRAALKAVITPLLRKHRFAGTCPHFRRLGQERYDLLTFEFGKYGLCFVIDLGQCPADWVPAGRIIPPPQKLAAWDLEPEQRARLHPGPYADLKTRQELLSSRLSAREPSPAVNQRPGGFYFEQAQTPDDYRRIAESVIPYVEQALAMFEGFQHVPKIGQII